MKFLDEAKIYLQSGNGGNGCVSFRREKFVEYGGPDGGDGGNGGDIVFRCVANKNTLIDFRYKQHYKAKRGEDGKGKKRKGSNGSTLFIEVPIGTSVYSDDKSTKLLELDKENTESLFLKGGKGGFGNFKFKSSRNISPKNSNPGFPGQEIWVRLRLNLIADIGIIGLPNVGKSSLLKTITNANPKVGNYPFTTLYPNLGVINFDNFSELVLADIPGIIKNASQGNGLGIKFLGHIEKCNVLLHFIESSSKNVENDYRTIRNELTNYGKNVEKKKEIVILTKGDLCDENFKSKQIKKIKEITNNNALCISIKNKQSILELKNLLYSFKNKIVVENSKKWTP